MEVLPFELDPFPFALGSFVSVPPAATCRLKGWAVEVVAGDGGAEDEAYVKKTVEVRGKPFKNFILFEKNIF